MFRINRNLTPLWRKFGIAPPSESALSGTVVPVVNVETLEEELASEQKTATVQGNVTNVGDTQTITVPAAEKWAVTSIHLVQDASAASHQTSVFLELGGAGGTALGIFTNPVGATGSGVKTALCQVFDEPLIVEGSSVITAENIFGVGVHQLDMTVVYTNV